MSATVQKNWSELSPQGLDTQTKTLVELVIEIMDVWEQQNPLSESTRPTIEDPKLSGLEGTGGPMSSRSGAKTLLMLAFVLMFLLHAQFSAGQSISEQKKAVVFIFGTIHPCNPDQTAITDTAGKRVAVELPLGTGFFVDYPDPRPGSNSSFSYLVTAKHVLQDTDGTFLPSVTIRLNLKSPAGDLAFGFIRDLPVADSQGHLLWLHSANQSEDVVLLPLFPDAQEFEFTAISTTVFLNHRTLNSGVVAEGDDLYFIGLMEQYYGAKRNYPLVRRGSLALLTDEDIETPTGWQKVFIAELESWPGNSGSPVFLLGGRRDMPPGNENAYSLLGMIVGSFLNKFTIPLSGASAARQLEAGDKENIGMTCIVPATTIAEILDSGPAQLERDARVQRLQGVLR